MQNTRGSLNEIICKCLNLAIDSNQKWDVAQAIDWVTNLSEFDLYWIEEPTSPDDIAGHAEISKVLKPKGIGVATGENCQNRVMFKQFLQTGAIQFCQLDTVRLGSLNEAIIVLLMCSKFNVLASPHAGGVGEGELAIHLGVFDYIAVCGSLEDRAIEYIDHLHEHFVHPAIVQHASYIIPEVPGYNAEIKPESLLEYKYPEGTYWRSHLSLIQL